MKRFIFIILAALAITPVSPVLADTTDRQLLSDALPVRLEELKAKVVDAVSTPEEYAVIGRLHEEAVKEGSALFEALSYYYYVHYYYSNFKKEEMVYWQQRLDSIARPNKFYELMYEGYELLIGSHCVRGDFGLAMEQAKKMSDEAALLNCPLTGWIAKKNLATVYLSTRQDKEGVKILEEIMSASPEKVPFSVRQSSLLLLVSTSLRLHQLDKAKVYLYELHEMFEEKDPDSYLIGSVKEKSQKFRYYVYSVQFYLLKGDFVQAEKYLKEVEKLSGSTSYIYSQALHHKICADYYAATGQPELALQEWEQEMSLLDPYSGYYLSALRNKADLLRQQKKYKDAFDAYNQYTLLRDSVEQKYYIVQINQFKAKHEAEQKQLINEQLSLESYALLLLVIGLSLFCIILFILILVNRKLRKNLLLIKQKSERSGLLKSAFLANMNHEIRTPLNAIAGFSQLLVDETDPETSEQYIHIIKGNNELLVSLLNDVLDLSGIESDTITFTYTKVEIRSVVNDLYEAAKLQIPSSIILTKEAEPDLYIYTDRNRLIQILSNLISNAIKHTREGQIIIGYDLINPDKVRFYVTDTGEGISEEMQDSIFARFVQAVKTHSRGVGLGLALCKGFVEHLGGDIGVESVEGEGSTFWFTLPCRIPDSGSF